MSFPARRRLPSPPFGYCKIRFDTLRPGVGAGREGAPISLRMFASASALLDAGRVRECRALRPSWAEIFNEFSLALRAYVEGDARRALDGFNACVHRGKGAMSDLYEVRDLCRICWWVLVSARCLLRSSDEGARGADVRHLFDELKNVLSSDITSQCRNLGDPSLEAQRAEDAFQGILRRAGGPGPRRSEANALYLRSDILFSVKKLLFDLCSSHIKSKFTNEKIADLQVQGTTEQLAGFLYSQGAFTAQWDPSESADALLLSLLLTRKARNRAVVMRKLIPLCIFTGQLVPASLARRILKVDFLHAMDVERRSGRILPVPPRSLIWEASGALGEGLQASRALLYGRLLTDLLLAIEKGDTSGYKRILREFSPVFYQERSLTFLSKGVLLCEEVRLCRVIRRLLGVSAEGADALPAAAAEKMRLSFSQVAACYDELYPPEPGCGAARSNPQPLLSTMMTLMSYPCSMSASGPAPRYVEVFLARICGADSEDVDGLEILLNYGALSFLNRRTPLFSIIPKLLKLAPQIRPCASADFVGVCLQVVGDYLRFLQEESAYIPDFAQKKASKLGEVFPAFEAEVRGKLAAWKRELEEEDRDSTAQRRKAIHSALKGIERCKGEISDLAGGAAK